VRTLPGPIERVWDYLTDAEKRSRWFAGGQMEPRTGGKMELIFRHKNISPDETPPESHKEHHDPGSTMAGTILRWEPPRVLSYTFDENSDVTFELTPQGSDVLLVLTHRARGDDIQYLTGYASGWHTHFAILIALLEGSTPPPFWATHGRLKLEYEKIKATLPEA
ncbi:MAG: SRPBCC family protein, partial [Opitutus sp.]